VAWGTEYWEQPRRARPRNVTAYARTKHALFRGNQVKDWELLCLPVEVQLEAIDQQGLKHQHKLIPGSRTFCLRHNIKSVVVEPLWPTGNMRISDAKCRSNKLPERVVLHSQSSLGIRHHRGSHIAGFVGLDRGDLELRQSLPRLRANRTRVQNADDQHRNRAHPHRRQCKRPTAGQAHRDAISYDSL